MKSKAFVLLLIPLAGLLSEQPGEVGPSSAPQIAELSGLVTRYDEKSASFIPVRIGEPISEPTFAHRGRRGTDDRLSLSNRGPLGGKHAGRGGSGTGGAH